MLSVEQASERLFSIWLNDDGVSEDEIRERTRSLREELHSDNPEELYGNVLHAEFEKMITYKQGVWAIQDLMEEIDER
jgi:hypothetical protein